MCFLVVCVVDCGYSFRRILCMERAWNICVEYVGNMFEHTGSLCRTCTCTEHGAGVIALFVALS